MDLGGKAHVVAVNPQRPQSTDADKARKQRRPSVGDCLDIGVRGSRIEQGWEQPPDQEEHGDGNDDDRDLQWERLTGPPGPRRPRLLVHSVGCTASNPLYPSI